MKLINFIFGTICLFFLWAGIFLIGTLFFKLFVPVDIAKTLSNIMGLGVVVMVLVTAKEY